jgi:hypothetical protein
MTNFSILIHFMIFMTSGRLDGRSHCSLLYNMKLFFWHYHKYLSKYIRWKFKIFGEIFSEYYETKTKKEKNIETPLGTLYGRLGRTVWGRNVHQRINVRGSNIQRKNVRRRNCRGKNGSGKK